MIAFDLFCSNGHKFECWFKDSDSFEIQKSSGLINCPICNDDRVEKAFSPFGIKKNGAKKREAMDAYHALQAVQEYIDKHFEDVGIDFTKEALKIHYGESKKRNIRGTATPDEENVLKEEGIPFVKVPIVKRLDN
ncbi:MAG: hypothetical protein A2170_14850 [Deltaproteobacteria bacterium RBG_13_53_10]|nr:MAG: hypothetical protein A2170_14850 [Deltaproteobacteria bacterium RBG_13_53_10]